MGTQAYTFCAVENGFCDYYTLKRVKRQFFYVVIGKIERFKLIAVLMIELY